MVRGCVEIWMWADIWNQLPGWDIFEGSIRIRRLVDIVGIRV